jgi:uroporphyrinogen-III synthase
MSSPLHLASSGTRTSKSPIFLLKTKSTPHDGYDEYFTAQGYEPRFIPVLEHKFHNANLQIVRDLFVSGTLTEKYGGLIFTSQRAVEGFASAMQDIEIGGMHVGAAIKARN